MATRDRQYGRAAAARPAGTYARIIALDLAAEAEMQLKQGHIEQACATWNRSMDHTTAVHCLRTRKAVKNMRSALGRSPARGIRSAVELDERAIGFLAST